MLKMAEARFKNDRRSLIGTGHNFLLKHLTENGNRLFRQKNAATKIDSIAHGSEFTHGAVAVLTKIRNRRYRREQ